MKISKTSRLLVKAEAMRVLELLDEIEYKEDGEEVSYWAGNNFTKLAELKCKMKELRRDTMKIEKQLKGEVKW